MSLSNILSRLSEKDLAAYLKTIDDFQSSCKFQVIKDSYSDLVDAFDKYLATVREPVKVRNRMNPFFDMLALPDNPANDQRILRKYREKSDCSEEDSSNVSTAASIRMSFNVSSSPEEPDIYYFQVPTQPHAKSVPEAITIHLQHQDISEATQKGYKTMIIAYIVICQEHRWHFNGPYDEAVNVLIKYLKLRYKEGLHLARIRSFNSGIKMFYNMMDRKDANPTKNPKLKMLFQDIQKLQERGNNVSKEIESDVALSSIASENEIEKTIRQSPKISQKIKKPDRPHVLKSNKTVLSNYNFYVPSQPQAATLEDAINKFLDSLGLSQSTYGFYKGSMIRYLRGCQELNIDPNAPYESAVAGIIKYMNLRASDGVSYKSLLQEKILIKKYYVMMGREGDRNPSIDKRVHAKLKEFIIRTKPKETLKDVDLMDVSDATSSNEEMESDPDMPIVESDEELEIQLENTKREKESWDAIYEIAVNERYDELVVAMESYKN